MVRFASGIAVFGFSMSLLFPIAIQAKPRVWVISDLSKPSSAADKDDLVTLSAFLLMANKFDVVGMTVGADSRSADNCGDAAVWANANFSPAYAAEAGNLNKALSGFPVTVSFLQSAWCSGQFNAATALDLNAPKNISIKKLAVAAAAGPLIVLNWGELVEAAYAVKYLQDHDKPSLDNLSIVSHWTYPSGDSNCKNGASGCSYLHDLAKSGGVKFYELGPIGQKGLVDNSCKGNASLDKAVMSASRIGNYMNQKWTGVGAPDFSDGATFMVVAGFGGGLGAYKHDGSYDAAGEARLCMDRGAIFGLLETNAKIAKGGTTALTQATATLSKRARGEGKGFRANGTMADHTPEAAASDRRNGEPGAIAW